MSEPRATYQRQKTAQTTQIARRTIRICFRRIQPGHSPEEAGTRGAYARPRSASDGDGHPPSGKFYLESHQHIYRAIIRLFEHSNPVDPLPPLPKNRGSGDPKAGAVTLLNSATVLHLRQTLNITPGSLYKKHPKGTIRSFNSETTRDAYEDTTDVFNMLEKTESGLFNISHKRQKPGIMIRDLTTAVLLETEAP